MNIQCSYTTKEEMKRVEDKLFEVIMEEMPRRLIVFTIKFPFVFFILGVILETFFSIEEISGIIPGIAEYILIPIKENVIKVISKVVYQHFTDPAAAAIISLPQLLMIGVSCWILLKLSMEVLKVVYKFARAILKERRRSKFTEARELQKEINRLIHLKEIEEAFSSECYPEEKKAYLSDFTFNQQSNLEHRSIWDEKTGRIRYNMGVELPKEVIKQIEENNVADFSFIDVKWQNLKRAYNQNFV